MGNLKEIGFTELFKIRTCEIDIKKRITIPALVQLLQEASMSNAIKLGVSVWDLEDRSLSWVLVKKQIDIMRLPILGETIKVITYPSGIERLFAYRDFIVKDDSDNVIVTASSTWVLMDTKSRKIVIPDLEIPTPSDIVPLPRPSFKFARLDSAEFKNSFDVNWHDLDWNKHVNNVFILKCILEGLPDELLQYGTVNSIKIQFKTESFWKEKLMSNFQKMDSHNTLHSITNNSSKVVALAEIKWK